MIRNPSERADRVRRTLGWAHWPSFVWKRVPPKDRHGSVVTRSILHCGYGFSVLALTLDAALALWLGLPAMPLFILGHLLWISAVVSVVLLHPRYLEHLDGRPLERMGWANWLTLLRISLLPTLVYLLTQKAWGPALAGYVVLGLTDVADGAVARRRREESKIGFLLDPFGDILFHLGILISLTLTGILSWGTGGLVLARYGLLLAGCLALYWLKGEIWIQPTPFGKATGMGISVLTALMLLLLGSGWVRRSHLIVVDRVLFFLFAACVVHVLLIGWNNFRRPAQGGMAVYRRGWGLLVGQRQPMMDKDPEGTDKLHQG